MSGREEGTGSSQEYASLSQKSDSHFSGDHAQQYSAKESLEASSQYDLYPNTSLHREKLSVLDEYGATICDDESSIILYAAKFRLLIKLTD